MRVLGSFILVLGVGIAAGCGGAAHTPDSPSRTAPERRVALAPTVAPVRPEPLELDVQARRMGGSLNLAIVGTGRGRLEAESFEEPERWSIEVKQAGLSLKRTVNGPVSVARNPVGKHADNRWDVTVRFSVSFLMDTDTLPLEVTIVAPNEPPASVTIESL